MDTVTFEETEAQRGQATCPKSHSCDEQRHDLNPGGALNHAPASDWASGDGWVWFMVKLSLRVLLKLSL